MAASTNAPKTQPATAPKAAEVKPVKAVCRIDGTILPGTIFAPKSEKQRDELLALEAVVELSTDEATLFTLTPSAPAATDTDVIE